MDNAVIESPERQISEKKQKFQDPDKTATGETRAQVSLDRLETLWINTGTLCNIECANCYIESSPKNDRLVYISAVEVAAYLDEISTLDLGTREIGFTGGEPFMNPDILAMVRDALSRGHEVLILTNAMQPMQRKRIKDGLLALNRDFGARLSLRVSLDHYTCALHETERGKRTWDITLAGIDWLSENGFGISLAGRTCWGESETDARAGYAALIKKHDWRIDAQDLASLVLFPEMDENADAPEITESCWGILNSKPSEQMCATSRMIVKRKGAAKPTVVPCTLLPYDLRFEMGSTLAQSRETSGGMFEKGAVKLCHPHCSRFCVLGGGACSV